MTLEDLEREVVQGRIDTVVTAFPDLYGRLVGKRITGHFFLEETAEHGMHCCDYLLACDMEMDPVPGYEFASWDKGYGDFRAIPDLATNAGSLCTTVLSTARYCCAPNGKN